MTLFDWLKGLQTGMALTAFMMTITCGSALWTNRKQRPLHEGFMMTVGVFLIGIALVLGQGWQTMQYWVVGIDGPVQSPTKLRIVTTILFLTGGGLFVSLTQQLTRGIGPTFAIWTTLIAMIVVMIALSA